MKNGSGINYMLSHYDNLEGRNMNMNKNGNNYNCFINNIYTKLNIVNRENDILYCNNIIYYKQKYILGNNFIGLIYEE